MDLPVSESVKELLELASVATLRLQHIHSPVMIWVYLNPRSSATASIGSGLRFFHKSLLASERPLFNPTQWIFRWVCLLVVHQFLLISPRGLADAIDACRPRKLSKSSRTCLLASAASCPVAAARDPATSRAVVSASRPHRLPSTASSLTRSAHSPATSPFAARSFVVLSNRLAR